MNPLHLVSFRDERHATGNDLANPFVKRCATPVSIILRTVLFSEPVPEAGYATGYSSNLSISSSRVMFRYLRVPQRLADTWQSLAGTLIWAE